MKNNRLTSRILGIALAFVLIGAMLPLGAFGTHSQVRAAPATIYVPDDYLTIQGAHAMNAWGFPEPITYTDNGNPYTNYLGNCRRDCAGSDVDEDGVGNTPYVIDGDGDNYPLMKTVENHAVNEFANIYFDKSADPGTYSEPGQDIIYTFTIANDGSVTIFDVAVTDTMQGLSSIHFLGSTQGSPEGTLLPCETATYGATYTITQADLDAGFVYNVATASGTDAYGDVFTMSDSMTVVGTDSEVGHITLIDPLSLTHGPYTVGQTLTATFRIKNAGNAAITLDKLLLGGRYEGGELPWGGYPDFTYEAVTLAPEQTHLYQGTFTIPAPGDYHFFIAYYIENPTEAEKQYLDEHNWNTHIDLGPGLTDADRTRQISASSLYTHTIAYIPVTYKDFGAPTHTVQELKQRAAMVVDYYEQQSYGKVQIDFEFIFNEWEELGKTLEEYNNLEFPEDEAAVAFDALQLAGVSTNEYDAIIVVEPYGEHESAAWDEPYNMVLTTDRRTYATWAHELGHVIFKWDEYYGEYSEDFTIGRGDIEYWGLMGRATLMNPTAPTMSYNKVLAGWLDYDTILPDQYGTYPVKLLMELQRDDQVHRYQTKADATTKYYIFEGRHPPDGIQTDPWDDYTWGDYEYRLDEEKGVLLYRVYLKQGIEHVSAIPHVGALTWSDDTTNRVTLTPGDTYPDDLAGVTFTAHENDSELSIEISGYTPLSRTIISLSELSWEVSGTSVLSEPFPSENRLDIDLHMYAYDGQEVGMDYATGEYLVQIEDARTSGNTPGGGPEWISIPQGTKIYFTIDPTPARKWGEERGLSITEIEAEIEAVFFDAEGERTETEPTKIPVDPDKPAKLIIEDGEIRLLASVDFDPNTLNLRGRGGGVVTVYIELPEGFDVNDIDVSSIRLNGTVPALNWPTAIGDYNDNGTPDLMVKFDTRAVHEVVEVGEAVEITITGEVDGIPFMGVDTIRVIDPTWYSLEISSTTGGSVTVPGEGTFSYKGGTVVSLVATPVSDCYSFAYWTGDVGTIADVSAPSTTITMNGDCSIIANFEERAVAFPDPNLEAAIRGAINKPAGPIYPSDLEGLTYFSSGANMNIANLTGLECCTNLEYLYLYLNRISDISPLANLTNLAYLHLGWNQISDISPLGSLTNLYGLMLLGNQIDDISPLAHLTNLTALDLDGNIWISDISPLGNVTSLVSLSLDTNRISDISPLANLSNLATLHLAQNRISDISALDNLASLTEVWLQFNQISDVSGLVNLTKLTEVDLRYNQIGDISPLVQNEGLGTDDKVDLRSNPLSPDSINIYIPQLEARGVTVYY